MYHKILFYHDENGKPVPKGEKGFEPRILTPEMCYAKSFEVSIYSHERNNATEVRVTRVCLPLKQNEWNEDNRPPTVLFTIEYAHVTMFDGIISVVGFESPNLTIAGIPSESYAQRNSKKRWNDPSPSPISDMISNRRTSCSGHPWEPISEYGEIYPQKIVILPKENS